MFRIAFIASLLLLIFIRAHTSDAHQSDKALFTQPQLSIPVLKVLAGHIPNLVADFKVLDVFSLYDAHLKWTHDNFGKMLYSHLEAASQLDPQFQDVYRLASSLLAFDAKMPRQAVLLLQRGTEMMPNKWEPPFFGGFLAASQLHDYDLAYALMSTAAKRENATPSAVFMAARYLEHKSTKEDTILFLKSMLKTTPKMYQAGIKAKIKELQQTDH
jgi:hypothetical protein